MFKPLHDYVLVVQNTRAERTVGSIVLADTHKGLESGIVLAVGPGYVNADGTARPLTVKVGDTVYLNGNPLEFVYEGGNRLLFREHDLIGVEVEPTEIAVAEAVETA